MSHKGGHQEGEPIKAAESAITLFEAGQFAIASSFKLFILGRLAEEVNEHRRRLESVMHLQADLVGPPSSELAEWPTHSPVTLQTLALKMITISDNGKDKSDEKPSSKRHKQSWR